MTASTAEIVQSVSDKFLPLVDAVEQETGRRPHLSTCLRWCDRGSRGVRLESRVIGGRRMTTTAWVAAFVEAVTAASVGGIAPAIESPKERAASTKQAAQKLAKRLAAK